MLHFKLISMISFKKLVKVKPKFLAATLSEKPCFSNAEVLSVPYASADL